MECFLVLCIVTALLGCGDARAYRAAVSERGAGHSLSSLVQEASRQKSDIMVLPYNAADADHDENVRTLSAAAREGQLYLVAHVSERARCGDQTVTLVFDREGNMITEHRTQSGNCSATHKAQAQAGAEADSVFRTDFGVTFALMAEEQLVRGGGGGVDGAARCNYVLVPASDRGDLLYFAPGELAAGWAHAHRVNVLSSPAPAPASASATAPLQVIEVNDLCPTKVQRAPVVVTRGSSGRGRPHVVQPLHLAPGAVRATVCHHRLCCHFTATTQSDADLSDVSYGVAAYDGAGAAGRGVQSCALVACTGRDKRTCTPGSHNRNVLFQRLTITANFSKSADVAIPVVLTTRPAAAALHTIVKEDANVKTVTMTLTDVDSLVTFEAFAGFVEREYISPSVSEVDIYSYVFNEETLGFFDYMWIRVRVLMFIVSIYILEML